MNRVAQRPRAGITASGRHCLLLAGFFHFLLAGNGVAAYQVEQARSWAIRSAADLAVTCPECALADLS